MTPSRSNRGLLVPSLDTKQSLEDIATALAYGGLHTPPQSAHESRRPSLQHIWPEASSQGPPSVVGYSQPSTPVHQIYNRHDDVLSSWSDASLANSSGFNRPLEAHLTETGYHHDIVSTPPTQSFLPCTGPGQYSNMNTFSMSSHMAGLPTGAWHQSAGSTVSLTSRSTYLGMEPFRLEQSLSSNSDTSDYMHHNSDLGFRSLNTSFEPSGTLSPQRQPFVGGVTYSQPQVIVPSQLVTPDLYYHSQVEEYVSPGSTSDEFARGVTSSAASFDSFGALSPPSVVEGYIGHLDEEDVLILKDEEPYKGSALDQSVEMRFPSRVTKNRTSKRGKIQQPWHEQTVAGIKIECIGEPFPLDGRTKHETVEKKSNSCQYLNKNGKPCGRRFLRNEHLTRHEGSHTNIRPFRCPIKACGKRFGRSDNACDHLKTHLKPRNVPRGTKRNSDVEWPALRQMIVESPDIDEKRTEKLCDLLGKWVSVGMPETGKRRSG